jgi:hypothetical protein
MLLQQFLKIFPFYFYLYKNFFFKKKYVLYPPPPPPHPPLPPKDYPRLVDLLNDERAQKKEKLMVDFLPPCSLSPPSLNM